MLYHVRWMILAAAVVSTGCATPPPELAKFGGAATALADSYRPILASPSRLCAEASVLTQMATDLTFDVRRIDDEGRRNAGCQTLADQQATRSVVADAIAAYGEQLSLLAGADPKALAPDIAGIATAAKGIQTQGGDPLFDATRIDALSRITAILVELARTGEARRTARDVMAQAQQPLGSLVGEMQTWTEGTVIPRLKSAIDRRQALMGGLVAQSDASATRRPLTTYPSRLAQVSLLEDIEALQRELKTAQAFVPASTAFVDSHQALREALDSPDKDARITAVRRFVDQLRALRKAATAL